MNEESDAFEVEVFLQNAYLKGIYRQLRSRLRLIDMLNADEDVIEFEDVRVWLGAQAEAVSCPSMTLAKRSILAAIPHEPAELRRRAALTNILTTTPRTQASVTLVLPPIAVEGTAHLSLGAGAIGLKNFTKFFSVTGATLHLGSQPDRPLPVVLVSRDNIGPYSIRPVSQKLAV